MTHFGDLYLKFRSILASLVAQPGANRRGPTSVVLDVQVEPLDCPTRSQQEPKDDLRADAFSLFFGGPQPGFPSLGLT